MPNKEATVATPRKTRSRGLRNKVSIFIDQVSNGIAALSPSRLPNLGISPDSRPKKPLKTRNQAVKTTKTADKAKKTSSKKTPPYLKRQFATTKVQKMRAVMALITNLN